VQYKSVLAAWGVPRLSRSRNGTVSMTDDLITDQEIAILCDVLEGRSTNLSAGKKSVLEQLIAKGFVTASDNDSPAKYRLASKAQQLLAERGVGLSGG